MLAWSAMRVTSSTRATKPRISSGILHRGNRNHPSSLMGIVRACNQLPRALYTCDQPSTTIARKYRREIYIGVSENITSTAWNRHRQQTRLMATSIMKLIPVCVITSRYHCARTPGRVAYSAVLQSSVRARWSSDYWIAIAVWMLLIAWYFAFDLQF
jgi:hypothetical protein